MSVLNGPGEGTWSAFAMKVVEERDAAREAREDLRKELAQWKVVATEVIGMFDPVIKSGTEVDWPHLKSVCVGAKEANKSLREVKDRARRACQLLVEEIGADGPADVDAVADRAAVLIRELRDQVADLEAAAEESEHQMHLRIRSGYDKTIADSWRAHAAKIEAERDEARAQVARREREHEALVETAQKALAHVAAERDLLKNHYSPEAAAKLRAELASARAEIEMLRGVGCREAKLDEPESGPCGVCLKCAEERGTQGVGND